MVVFSAIDTIQLFISIFTDVYVVVLIMYIIVSMTMAFGLRLPYSLQPVHRFLYDVCEPYLALWRRMLPFLRIGMFDLTPIVAILALGVASRVAIGLLGGLE
jgi:YggT family protein